MPTHKYAGDGSGLAQHIDSNRRQRMTVVATLLVGTTLLAATLRAPSGSTTFFVMGSLVAATWIMGSVISGPIRLAAIRSSLPSISLQGLAVGIVAFLGFLAAYLAGQHIPLISNSLHNILTKADAGPTALVLAVALVNGLGEEFFFRGALFDVLGSHHPVVSSLIVYAAVTATTGNVALVLAAGAMGIIFSLERWRTGGILASTVTHLCWSTLMLLALPR